jgi:putative transposase
LYRAVDKEKDRVDFMLSEKRDEPAARAFFEKAMSSIGLPDKVTMDKSGANKAVLSQIFSKTKSRVILDELMPRDHRIVQK